MRGDNAKSHYQQRRRMQQEHGAMTLRKKTWLTVFRIRNLWKKSFECPVCGYVGPLMDVNPPTGFRRHAKCPKCGVLERHRLQYLAVMRVLAGMDPAHMKMLHFAPEACFRSIFAKEFGGYGIRVNTVVPGLIETRVHEKFSTAERRQRVAKQTPLGRNGTAEDIAKAILFLSSNDAANFITGEYLAVNGGLYMRA